MNVTRYEPYGEVRGIFDDFFRGFFVQPVNGDAAAARQVPQRMRVDVAEEDNAYRVTADVPGMKKEDIQVTFENDVLAITAESKSEVEKKDGERLVYSERRSGRFHRAFRLGVEVDFDKAEAKYDNGVLELTLPKRAPESARRLTIN